MTGWQSPTSTVVTIRDLLLSESVTLGPRPLEISVMFKPSEGLHAPTWKEAKQHSESPSRILQSLPAFLNPHLAFLTCSQHPAGLEKGTSFSCLQQTAAKLEFPCINMVNSHVLTM